MLLLTAVKSLCWRNRPFLTFCRSFIPVSLEAVMSFSICQDVLSAVTLLGKAIELNKAFLSLGRQY